MNYVVNMLAKPEAIRVTQFGDRVNSVDKGMELYLKNSYVCLRSVMENNSNVNCLLAVSFELPDDWKKRFLDAGIEVVFVEFGKYKIGNEFNWGIVQYRYDVINYLCGRLDEEDKVIMLDTDVICTGSLSNVLDEVTNRICLYDVQHSKDLVDRKNICDNYKRIYSDVEDTDIIHYGGEFIGATGKNLKLLFEESVKIMVDSSQKEGLVNFNDEHITSIAIDRLWDKVKVNNANAYICRYWTAKKFYLTSTNYHYNPVVLWHLPVEKDRGIVYIYNKLVKTKTFPSKQKMAKIFGFPKAKRSNIILNYWIQMKHIIEK